MGKLNSRRRCSSCTRDLPRTAFSNTQLVVSDDTKRRCSQCIDRDPSKKKGALLVSVTIPKSGGTIKDRTMAAFLSPASLAVPLVASPTAVGAADAASPPPPVGTGVSPTTITQTMQAMIAARHRDAQKRLSSNKAAKVDLYGILPQHTTYGMGRNHQLSVRLKSTPLCTAACPAYKVAGIHMPSCEHGIILDAQKAAGTYTR